MPGALPTPVSAILLALALGLVHPGSPTSWADGPGAPAAPSAEASLLVGTFPLADDPVTDGDTLRLGAGAPGRSVRVQSVDAEEVAHGEAEGERPREGEAFARYAIERRGRSSTPTKYPTPAGDEARRFVRDLLRGVASVRLERDEAGRDRDGHGRVLAHVFLTGADGRDVLLAEALVEAGWSPYFVKYGRSRRFDARLAAAQARARAARRGIWDDAVAHYPDYPERLAWWEARARQVDAWREDVAAQAALRDAGATMVELGTTDATARLPALVGRRVTVFGSVERELSERPPSRILLVDRPDAGFPLVVFDPVVWRALDHDALRARFVRATGVVSEFRGRAQIRVDAASSIDSR